MDYRPRKISGLAVTIFLLYTGFVIWSVLSQNPYLYSHFELKSKLAETSDWIYKPVPARETTAWTAPLTFSAEQQEKEKNDVRESSWDEWHRSALALPDFNMTSWIHDEDAFYLYSKDRIVAVNNEGQIIWQYRALPAEGDLFRPDVDSKYVYFAQTKGSVGALDRKTGQVMWWNELSTDILQQPLFVKSEIWLLTKAAQKTGKSQNQTFEVLSVRRSSGEVVSSDKDRSFDLKTVSYWQWSDALEQLIVISDARVYAFSKDIVALWNQNLGATIQASPTIIGSSIYVATKLGRFFKLDGKRKGKVDWEADVEGVPSVPAVYIPLVSGLMVGSEDGYWHYFENKSGQRKWKLKIDNTQNLKMGWPLRMSVKHYEEFKLHWPHKGWTAWVPCGSESLCVIGAEKGHLAMRQSVGGALDGVPRFDRFITVVVKGKNGLEMRQFVGPVEKRKLLKEKAVKEGKPLPPEEPQGTNSAL